MVFNRLKWFLGIGLIFFVVLATNLIDRNNFLKMKNSVETIYKDRLVASDLILSMSNILHKKELGYERDSTLQKIDVTHSNQKFKKLLLKFEGTKLTREESELFVKLQNNWDDFRLFESKINTLSPTITEQLHERIKLLKSNLLHLSKIQVKEGNIQVSNSNKAMATIELFTNFEIVLLILLALTVQIIVISNKKESAND